MLSPPPRIFTPQTAIPAFRTGVIQSGIPTLHHGPPIIQARVVQGGVPSVGQQTQLVRAHPPIVSLEQQAVNALTPLAQFVDIQTGPVVTSSPLIPLASNQNPYEQNWDDKLQSLVKACSQFPLQDPFHVIFNHALFNHVRLKHAKKKKRHHCS